MAIQLFSNYSLRGILIITLPLITLIIPTFIPLCILGLFLDIHLEKRPITTIKTKQFKVLWPQRNDVDGVTDDLFEIKLPEPPMSVKEVLAKCYQHNISIFTTAHEKAIQVVVDGAKRKELSAKYDPAICTRENKMVAVLEQFGDFPEEKEVIQYIYDHFEKVRTSLLKTNHPN
jgi:hypothetical protein